MRSIKSKSLVIAAVASLSLFTAACGSSDDDASSSSDDTSSAAPDDSAAPDEGADPAANLVGPGCADYAEQVPDGAGSVEGMAADPVAVAASNNPLLTTLTAAVSGELNPDVDLVDTLNGGEFTVFAPVDDAFAALPSETVDTLGTPEGAETLTSVLTYHVIAGQLSPDDVVGEHETVNGASLEVTGTPEELEVGGQAAVICGGVQTANATVYLIDAVMMPPA